MGAGFLAPLLLAGAALITIPWLVHRIRHPERRVVRFSSLLFVPETERRAMERRRVQHLLLMLLRMLMLLLAAFAFARPYRNLLLAPTEAQSGSVDHAVLLDLSGSMSSPGYPEEATERALSILDDLPAGDRVAVVTFARSAAVASPFAYPGETEGNSVQRARQAIDRAAPTRESTDYVAALQTAEHLLLNETPDGVGRVIHLISDFRESGMPPSASSWRLSPAITLDPVVVGAETLPVNLAVEELAARPLKTGQWQIRARVRNWSADRRLTARVRLVVAGKELEAIEREILPTSASQVVFALPWDGRHNLAGYVEIDPDDLGADDRRYFALNPSPQHRVLLVRRPGSRYDRLIEAAVPTSPELPWDLTAISPAELTAALADPPRIVVADDLEDLAAASLSGLRAYVRDGGRLFLPLGDRFYAASLDRLLDGAVGLHPDGRRAASSGTFARLAWVDLSHPIFLPFRGARFNDFSSLRFGDYHRFRVEEPGAVLARFQEESGDSFPAVIELPLGTGRLLLWTGGIDPAWSNLSRSPRFVPLLHETLRYLVADRPPKSDYLVGDPAVLPMQEQAVPPPWEVELFSPEGDPLHSTLTTGSGARLSDPGFFRWRQSGKTEWRRVEAVNVDAAESDPARIAPAEFAIRLCDAPFPIEIATRGESAQPGTVTREYGRAGVGLLLGLLLLESGYAVHLSRRSRKEDS